MNQPPRTDSSHTKWSVTWPAGVLPLVCLAWCGPALSQSRAATPAEPEPVRVAPFQPYLNVVESFVRQTNMPDTLSAREADRQTHEWVTQLSPGFKVHSKGTNQEIEGGARLDIIRYGKDSRPNQTIPIGALQSTTEWPDSGLGLKAGWAAQREASSTASGGDPNDGYSTMTWRVAPFFEKELSADTTLNAQVVKSLTDYRGLSETTPQRDDKQETTATASWTTHPSPLGYQISFTHNRQSPWGRRNTSSTYLFSESITRLRGTWAPVPEWQIGPIVGSESTRLETSANDGVDRNVQRKYVYDDSGNFTGWHARWSPEERAQLSLESENRKLGHSWQANALYRLAWTDMSARWCRIVTAYGSSACALGANSNLDLRSLNEMGTIATTLGAHTREDASGMLTLKGRRDTLTLEAGRADITPLQGQNTTALSERSRKYYFTSDFSHRLTRTTRFTARLNWTRAHSTLMSGLNPSGTYTFSRSFSWNTAISTDLSRQAAATLGLRRLIVHSTDPLKGDSGELAAFAGLGYRF